MKKHDEIEELFASGFEGFEKMPPLDVKNSIDKRLFENNLNKRKMGFNWFFFLIFLVGSLGIFGIILIENSNNPYYVSSLKNKDKLTNSQTQLGTTKPTIASANELQPTSPIQPKKELKHNNLMISLGEKNVNNENNKPKSFKSEGKSKKTKQKSGENNRKNKRQNSFEKFPFSNEMGNPGESDFNKIDDQTLFNNPGDNKKPESEIKMGSGENENIPNEFESGNTKNPSENTSTEITESETSAQTGDENLANDEKDSTKNDQLNNSENNGTTDIKLSNALSPWTLSMYSGVTYGLSSLNNNTESDYRVTEQAGIAFNLETGYSFGNKFGLSTGIDLYSRKDQFIRTIHETDSVFTGYSYQYVYDPINTDSIIDTITVSNYEQQTTDFEQKQLIQHLSIAIPISFTWKFYDKGKWSSSLSSGLRLAYVRNEILESDSNLVNPTFSSFGMRCFLRPQLDYTFKKIGIGCYLNLGYDLVPSVVFRALNESPFPTYQYIEMKRNRMEFGLGLVLKYQF